MTSRWKTKAEIITGLNKWKQESKTELTHTWKKHKLSTILYLCGGALAFLILYGSTILYKADVSFDSTYVTFLLLICVSWTVWSIYRTIGDSLLKDEEKKHEKQS